MTVGYGQYRTMGNIDKGYNLDDVVRLTLFALLIFISTLIFFVLIAIIATRPNLRCRFRNQQLVSAALGYALISLLVRPGTINVDLYINRAPPIGYCTLFYILSDFEVVFLLTTLLLLTIMAVLAEKGEYEDRLTWWQRGGVLIIPWVLGGVFTVFRRYVLQYDGSYVPAIHHEGCRHGYFWALNRGSVITWVIIMCFLTVLLLLALIALLVMHCYLKKPRQGNTNSMELSPSHEEPSEPSITPSRRRVAMLTVVNFMMIVVIILNICLKDVVSLETSFQWCFSLVEMLLAFVAMVALPDLNAAVMELYCHRRRKVGSKKRQKEVTATATPMKVSGSSYNRPEREVRQEGSPEGQCAEEPRVFVLN